MAKRNLFSVIKLCFICVVCCLLVKICDGKIVVKRGIMDHINQGLKQAGQMFGLNTAADVADLVSRAFAPTGSTKRHETSSSEIPTDQKTAANENFNAARVFTSLMRLMGFDSGKLSTLAINGVILIAQMIGNIFMSPKKTNPQQEEYMDYQDEQHQPRMDSRKPRVGSPIDWMLRNPSGELLSLFEQARDRKLPEQLIEYIREAEQIDGDGDCTKLLVCKIAPFIWGMQKSVANKLGGNDPGEENVDDKSDANQRLEIFFKYLPSVEEFKENGKICEQRFLGCNVTVKKR